MLLSERSTHVVIGTGALPEAHMAACSLHDWVTHEAGGGGLLIYLYTSLHLSFYTHATSHS